MTEITFSSPKPQRIKNILEKKPQNEWGYVSGVTAYLDGVAK